MKGLTNIGIGVFLVFFAMLGTAGAADRLQERDLLRDAARIDATTKTDQGQKRVVGQLQKEFNATTTQIQNLRNRKMGYGEIAIVFSCAANMPGGLTDANIDQIVAMRQGTPRMGWGAIANKTGTKLGPMFSQVRNVHRETNREMIRETRGRHEGMDHREMHQEQHREMIEHEGMGGGQGMSHGKGR